MTVFGDGALKGVIKVKRGHEGGPSSDWCPWKRRLGHGPLQRKDHMRSQGEDVHLQAKERGL